MEDPCRCAQICLYVLRHVYWHMLVFVCVFGTTCVPISSYIFPLQYIYIFTYMYEVEGQRGRCEVGFVWLSGTFWVGIASSK